MRKILPLIIAIVGFLSPHTSYGTTYVGKYFNDNYRYTLPVIIDFKANYLVDITTLKANNNSKIEHYELKFDSLIGEKHYGIAFDKHANLILTRKGKTFYFLKQNIHPTKAIDLTTNTYEFKLISKKNDFNVIENWQFSSDSIHIYRSYYYAKKLCYSEVEITPYYLYTHAKNTNFLVLTYKNHPYTIYSIRNDLKDAITFYNPKTNQTINGTKTKHYHKTNHLFEVTDKQHLDQYYQHKTKPHPFNGYAYFSKTLCQQLNTDTSTKEDGFIVLRYVLNKQGQLGRFELEQFNSSYTPITYASSLIFSLINSVSNSKWIPVSSQNEAEDCYHFLLFKIKNNTLIDVYV